MINQIIAAICLGIPATYNTACQQGFIAAGMQWGLTAKMERYEREIQTETVQMTGEKIWVVGGFAYTLSQRQLILTAGNQPNIQLYCNTIQQSVTLSWNF